KLDKPVLAPLFAGINKIVEVKAASLVRTRYLSGNLTGDIAHLEIGNAADAAFTSENLRPVQVDPDTERGDHSKTGDNYATHVFLLIWETIAPKIRQPPGDVYLQGNEPGAANISCA
ncbi:MAG: hypothetical protein ACPIFQ_09670, partial [Candidatus Puniceispirillaceae bacterium]